MSVDAGDVLAYARRRWRARGESAQATQFALLAGGVVVGSFMLAVTLGGQAIADRFMTLFATIR